MAEEIFESDSLDKFNDRLKQISQSISHLGDNADNIDKINKSLTDFQKAIKDQATALGKSGKATGSQIDQLNKLADAAENSQKKLNDQYKTFGDVRGALSAANKPLKEAIQLNQDYAEAVERASSFQGQFANAVLTGNGSFRTFIGTLGTAKSQIDSVSGSLQKAGVGASITAGAILYLGKEAGNLSRSIRDSISTLNQYQVQLSAVSKVSTVAPGGIRDLENLRSTIGTTRKEFQTFLPTLEAMGKRGLDTSNLETAAQNIVNLYGEGSAAQSAIKQVGELMMQMPTVEQDLKFSSSIDDQTSALYALAKEGKVDLAIKAGFLGGIEGGEAAEVQTDIQKSIRVQEDIADTVRKMLTPMSGSLTALTAVGDITGRSLVALGLANTLIGGFSRSNSAGLSRVESAVRQSGDGGEGGPAVGGMGKFGKIAVGVAKVGAGLAAVGAAAWDAYNVIKAMGEKFDSVTDELKKDAAIVRSHSFIMGASADDIKKFSAGLGTGATLQRVADSYGTALDVLSGKVSVTADLWEKTSKDLISNSMHLAASFAGAGAFVGTLIAPGVGTAIGAVAGGLIGLATSLFSYNVQFEAAKKELETIYKTRATQTVENLKGAMVAFGAVESEEGGRAFGELNMRDFQETIDESAKKLREIGKSRIKSARNFQAIIGALDAAAKSPIVKMYEMRTALGKTSAEIQQKLGGSTKLFLDSLSDSARAVRSRFARRITDINNVLQRNIDEMDDMDPGAINASFQEAQKSINEETLKLSQEFDKLVQMIGKTPGLIMAEIKSSLAGAPIDISGILGVGLDAGQFENLRGKQIEQAGKKLDELGKSFSVAVEESVNLAKGLSDANKASQETAKQIVSKGFKDEGSVKEALGGEKEFKEFISLTKQSGSLTKEQINNLKNLSSNLNKSSDAAQEEMESKKKELAAFEAIMSSTLSSQGSTISLDTEREDIQKEISIQREILKSATGENLKNAQAKMKELQKRLSENEKLTQKMDMFYADIGADSGKVEQAFAELNKAEKKVGKFSPKQIQEFLTKRLGKDIVDKMSKRTTELKGEYDEIKRKASSLAKASAAGIAATNTKDVVKPILDAGKGFYDNLKTQVKSSMDLLNAMAKDSSQAMQISATKLETSKIFQDMGSRFGMTFMAMSEGMDATRKNMQSSFEFASTKEKNMRALTKKLSSKLKDVWGEAEIGIDKALKDLEKSDIAEPEKAQAREALNYMKETGQTTVSVDAFEQIGFEKAKQATFTDTMKSLGTYLDYITKSVSDINREAKLLDVTVGGFEKQISLAQAGFGNMDEAVINSVRMLEKRARIEEEQANIQINDAINTKKKLEASLKGTEDPNERRRLTEAIGATEIAITQKRLDKENKMNELAQKRVQAFENLLTLENKRVAAERGMSEVQLDVLEQMGAPYALVLEKQAEIVGYAQEQAGLAQERFNFAQQEYAAGRMNLTALRERELDFVKARAEVTKKTLQAQRSTMEKMLGTAIGELGKIGGFKRNLLAQRKGTGLTIGPGGIVLGGAGTAKTKSQQAASIQTAAAIKSAMKDTKKPSKDLKEATDKSVSSTDALNETNKGLRTDVQDLRNEMSNLAGVRANRPFQITPPRGKPATLGGATPERVTKKARGGNITGFLGNMANQVKNTLSSTWKSIAGVSTGTKPATKPATKPRKNTNMTGGGTAAAPMIVPEGAEGVIGEFTDKSQKLSEEAMQISEENNKRDEKLVALKKKIAAIKDKMVKREAERTKIIEERHKARKELIALDAQARDLDQQEKAKKEELTKKAEENKKIAEKSLSEFSEGIKGFVSPKQLESIVSGIKQGKSKSDVLGPLKKKVDEIKNRVKESGGGGLLEPVLKIAQKKLKEGEIVWEQLKKAEESVKLLSKGTPDIDKKQEETKKKQKTQETKLAKLNKREKEIDKDVNINMEAQHAASEVGLSTVDEMTGETLSESGILGSLEAKALADETRLALGRQKEGRKKKEAAEAQNKAKKLAAKTQDFSEAQGSGLFLSHRGAAGEIDKLLESAQRGEISYDEALAKSEVLKGKAKGGIGHIRDRRRLALKEGARMTAGRDIKKEKMKEFTTQIKKEDEEKKKSLKEQIAAETDPAKKAELEKQLAGLGENVLGRATERYGKFETSEDYKKQLAAGTETVFAERMRGTYKGRKGKKAEKVAPGEVVPANKQKQLAYGVATTGATEGVPTAGVTGVNVLAAKKPGATAAGSMVPAETAPTAPVGPIAPKEEKPVTPDDVKKEEDKNREEDREKFEEQMAKLQEQAESLISIYDILNPLLVVSQENLGFLPQIKQSIEQLSAKMG